MSPTRFLLLAIGCATALSSCEVFKKDPPAEDPYAAANPYAITNPQGYPQNPAPAAGAYDPNNPYSQPPAGGYTQPGYNQPYTQPPTGGYAGNATAPGYDNTPPAGNYGAASGSGRIHKVAPGDNLTKIAKRYSVSVDALMRANNLQTDLIRQGENLRIP